MKKETTRIKRMLSYCLKCKKKKKKKKNTESINPKISLAGNQLTPEMDLKQLVFTYSASGPFPKNEEKIQKFK